MRQILQTALAEQAAYRPGNLAAPVRGWNARDALDAMPPGFAVQLDNFFPYNGFVTLRGGSANFATGLGGPVETLARWNDALTTKIIAGANGELWDVTGGGSVSLKIGFTSDRWQWTQTKGTRVTAGATTAYLYLVNGSDTPQVYDGATVTDTAFTAKAGGVTKTDWSNIQNIDILQDVLYMAEAGELGFWHSAKAIVNPTAEMSWFDLGTVLPNGGDLVAIASLTIEGGEGPDDYTIFVASTGWVAMYRGTDPNLATDWQIVGRFPLGQALGLRCVMEVAGDVIVMTVNGYISMRQFVNVGGLEKQSFAFNDNIQPEVVRQTIAYKNEFGWQPVLVPDLTLAIFNVPQSSNNFVQHIINTQTQAWAQLKGWNGLCWLDADGMLLFGDEDGNVVEANTGGLDRGGQAVIGEGLTAFSDFGSPASYKIFQLAQPILETIGEVTVRVSMAVNYDPQSALPPAPAPLPTVASEWDTGEWDTAIWGGAPVTRNDWYPLLNSGYSGALKLNVISTGVQCRWKSAPISYTVGGLL